MKKLLKLALCTVLTLITVTSLVGCTQSSNSTNDYSGYLWNDGDKTKHLKKFDPIMDEIPRDYLSYLNLNPDDYNIDTLEQWSTSNLGTGAAYHSYVYEKGKNPKSGFYIWVLDDGRVNDTRFVKDLEPVLQKYFSKKYEKKYPEVRVLTSLSFHDMPSKEWKEADGIDNLLNSNDDYNLFIYFVYGKDVTISEKDVETIKKDLSYLNDVKALFYRTDNPTTANIDELIKQKEEYSFYEHN